ncbi:MAG: response regulator transcription factor [Planctomycetes bacterium]|nr:response regulator transcription factor [Planctomycetota bacterium]
MRILVVEDEPHLAQALAKSLRDDGYAVDTARDGEEGLYKATSWEYDAILLDVMLPKRNGWEVLQGLRRSKKTSVLMLTARDSVEDRVRGLDGGADDYVVKPFDLEEVLARVRALIRRSTGNATSDVVIGSVTIDTASRTVTKDERSVPLTAREYALVEILALNRRRVVTRTELYEHLCDETDDTFSKVIEVHVSNVRKKLGKGFTTTRRGQGYTIEGDVWGSRENNFPFSHPIFTPSSTALQSRIPQRPNRSPADSLNRRGRIRRNSGRDNHASICVRISQYRSPEPRVGHDCTWPCEVILARTLAPSVGRHLPGTRGRSAPSGRLDRRAGVWHPGRPSVVRCSHLVRP